MVWPKKIFQDFLNKHKTTFYLDVKKDNKRAIDFYKKNNFVVVGEKKVWINENTWSCYEKRN